MSFDPAEHDRLRDRITAAGYDVPKLLRIWTDHAPEEWTEALDLIADLGERILRGGSPLGAYDVLDAGHRRHPDHPLLRRLFALTLMESGASDRAAPLVARMVESDDASEETLGIAARWFKDNALSAPPADRARLLEEALQAYRRAYSSPDRYWTGVNVATLTLLRGDVAGARAVAADVARVCEAELLRIEREGVDPLWPLATLGEAALVLGHWDEAYTWYARAARAAGTRYRDLRSTRQQARRIADTLSSLDVGASPADRDAHRAALEACFRLPAVAVFAGHMVDRPGRATPRFPPELEDEVDGEIRAQVEQAGVRFAFGSAACGADLLYLEAVLSAGGEATIVLPCAREQFVEESVAPVPGWRERFEVVIASPQARVVLASAQRIGHDGTSFEYANMITLGLARLHAAYLDTALVSLLVWDGRPGDGPGGTASVAARSERLGLPVRRVPIDRLLAARAAATGSPTTVLSARDADSLAGPSVAAASDAAAVPAGTVPEPARKRRERRGGPPPVAIKAMLFGDAVHFSRLAEEQVPRFVGTFMATIGRLTRQSPQRPSYANTWGDGLYMVFDDARRAGLHALALSDALRRDWSEHGLPSGMTLRIALHAGPVWACRDPVTLRRGFFGTHVNQAARIEPITPPGHVYASEAFAAIAAAEGITDFVCEYVGQTPLAKGYGVFPTYHVRRP